MSGDLPSHITLKQAFRTLLFVVIYLVVVSAIALSLGLLHLIKVDAITFAAYFLGIVTLASMLAIYLHLMRHYRLSFADLGFRKPRARMLHLAWQIPVTIVGATGIEGLAMTILGNLDSGKSRSGTTSSSMFGLSSAPLLAAVALIVIVTVLTPLWEEVLFRGAIFSGFYRRFTPLSAIALSAIFFALIHVVSLAMPYLFVLGISLAWLYRFHQNLLAPVLLHATNNSLVVAVVIAGV